MSKSADRLNSAINDFAESRNRGDALFELFKRATAFRDQGDHRRAIELFSLVLRERPVSAALNERGITYSACGDFDRAIADLTKAIELEPADADLYVNRANANQWKGNLDVALEDYDEAIRLSTRHANAHNGRGCLLRKLGRFSEAIDDFNRAIQLDELYASPRYNLAALQFKQGRIDESLIHLERARNLNPDDATIAQLHDKIRAKSRGL